MAFELIEHLFDFKDFIQDVNNILTHKGVFFFTCPNGNSIPMSDSCDFIF